MTDAPYKNECLVKSVIILGTASASTATLLLLLHCLLLLLLLSIVVYPQFPPS